jgi:CRISPR-associated protein Csc3
MPDFGFLEYPDDDASPPGISPVLEDYLKFANRKLRLYKQYLHTRGAKEGQSLYSHIMDLVTFVDRLFPVLALRDDEMRCSLLALSIHDINKIPLYGMGPDDLVLKYADAATQKHIEQELERLQVDDFFPEWREYLLDIVWLAHAHQASATGTTLIINQAYVDQTRLKSRLKGPLRFLMQAADVSDNSHSGDYRDPHEVHLRDRLLTHINAIMSRAGRPYEYRFIGHRLAELRGLLTNVIHNELVEYFREQFGEHACIDLQYYPEGVNYLLDTHLSFQWNRQTLDVLAERIRQKLAQVQFKQLAQFIKAKPSAIVVDDAAMNSGASLEQLFEVIVQVVLGKHYPLEWQELRTQAIRRDLEKARGALLPSESSPSALWTLPSDDQILRRGEFVSAYRKFLEDHHASALKAIGEDAWERAYHLFQLSATRFSLYSCIDPYRRGYFLASDLPLLTLDEMKQKALADLADLTQQATALLAKKKKTAPVEQASSSEHEEVLTTDTERAYLVDYLHRHLELWDSFAPRPQTLIPFGENLRRYANQKRPHTNCCHCGTALMAQEWMAAQVPPSIGVQQFSNRLPGGSSHEPKRNVCAICRTQFILDKLTWRGHRDKQGAEQVTFYLHLFPFAYFTRPLLRAWWLSVERLKDADHRAFFLDTRDYFRMMHRFQTEIRIRGFRTTTNGLSLPMLSETISTTPVLAIVAPGTNYGQQFLLALEKAVALVRWFECRAILSRSPVPPLNLAHEYIDGKPVVLMAEGIPRSMSWLVPETNLTRAAFEILTKKLTLLYQLSEKLFFVDAKSKDKTDHIPHDVAVAASDDPLALYFEADRFIEKKVAAEKGKGTGVPELQAIHLSRTIAPILDTLITL